MTSQTKCAGSIKATWVRCEDARSSAHNHHHLQQQQPQQQQPLFAVGCKNSFTASVAAAATGAAALMLLLTWEMNERWWRERATTTLPAQQTCRRMQSTWKLLENLSDGAIFKFENKSEKNKEKKKNIQKRIEKNQRRRRRRRRRRSTLTLTSLHVWQNVSHNVDCVQQLLLLLVLLLLLLLLRSHSSTLWLGWPGDFKAIPSWERESVYLCLCAFVSVCVWVYCLLPTQATNLTQHLLNLATPPPTANLLPSLRKLLRAGFAAAAAH